MTWDHFYCQPERAHIREEIRIIGKCFALFLFLLFLSLSFHLSQPHFQLWKRLERLKSPFWAQKRIAYFSWNKRRKAFNRIKTFSTMVKGENLLLNFHSFTEKLKIFFDDFWFSLFFPRFAEVSPLKIWWNGSRRDTGEYRAPWPELFKGGELLSKKWKPFLIFELTLDQILPDGATNYKLNMLYVGIFAVKRVKSHRFWPAFS